MKGEIYTFQLRELKHFIFIISVLIKGLPTAKTIPIPTSAPAHLLGDTSPRMSDKFRLPIAIMPTPFSQATLIRAA